MIGTERYAFLVEAARRNAVAAGVADLIEFRVDDICKSALPARLCRRAPCIGITPTLVDDAAFDSLLRSLDRIAKHEDEGPLRRIVLGSNRWGPSRMTAVRGILAAAANRKHDRASSGLVDAVRHLYFVELYWWLQPHHLQTARPRFPSMELIGETHDRIDGTRVDYVLT